MKKFKFLVGAVALFAIVVVNVWNAATTLRGSDLSVADVEAMANPEGMGGSGSSIGGEWKQGKMEDQRYFTMSGSRVDFHTAYTCGSYITTFYLNWDCVSRSAVFQCTPPETRKYPMRATYWAGDSGFALEGNSPGISGWDGYVLPY
jgi:hypothetical protein